MRGTPLVLLHALGGASGEWAGVQAALPDRFDVFAPDLPGHGRRPVDGAASPAAMAGVVAAELDARGWAAAHVAGSSLGGWVGLELAAAGRALSVTAFSPAGLWRPEECGGMVEARLGRLQALARLARPALPVLTRIGPLRRRAVGGAVAHPERLAPGVVAAAARALGDAVGYRDVHAALTRGHVPDGTRISHPVTVVFGAADPAPPAWRRTELLPCHAVVQTWPGVGHMVVWDAPERAASVIAWTARVC